MMKLRDKACISVAALCIVFLASAYAAFKMLPPHVFLGALAVEFVGLLVAMYFSLFFVFKRIHSIFFILQNILITKNYAKRIKKDMLGNDELSPLIESINSLVEKVETYQDDLDFQTKAYSRKLEKANALLDKRSVEFEELEKEIKNLKRLAHSDSLTSLPNRISFNETLNNALELAKKQNKKLAIMLVNLDNFKNVNEDMGSVNGDLIFKEIIKRFGGAVRRQDIMARFGGAVIVVLLNEVESREEVDHLSEKILETCAQPIKIDNKEIHIVTSIGVSMFPEDGETIHDLLKNADMAMFKAKKAGGRVYQKFTQEMNLEMEKLSKLGVALRSGFNSQEFVLHYQPKFNVKEGLMVGVEALLRWESLALGLIKPARFIPLAEETDFIIELGEWVLHQACSASKSWQEKGFQPISVAVNLSHKQFHYQNIANLVENALNDAKLEPKLLELEIPEAVILDDAVLAIKKLSALKELGVNISIDHFGTESTTLSYLKQLPIDFLKIDKKFISGVPTNHADVAVTSGAIGLAHQMGIKAVALGVECREQMQYLTANDCDIVQGYLFSMPLSQSDFVAGTKLIFT